MIDNNDFPGYKTTPFTLTFKKEWFESFYVGDLRIRSSFKRVPRKLKKQMKKQGIL